MVERQVRPQLSIGMTIPTISPKHSSGAQAEVRFPEIAEELRTWCDGNLALGAGSEGYHCHGGVIRGQHGWRGNLMASLR